MKNDNLTIAAIPCGNHYHLDCSQCGDLGQVPLLFRDQTAMTHLAGHGCHVPALYQMNLN